jgi:flagellar FliJ protein
MTTRYNFPLAGVLRLRRAEYEQAALALAQANTALRELIASRERAAAECRANAATAGPQHFEDFLRERQGAERSAVALVAAEARVNVAAAEAALARIAWTAAHRRVAALERLDDRRRDEWSSEQSRVERLELDELATVAFVRELQSQAGGR